MKKIFINPILNLRAVASGRLARIVIRRAALNASGPCGARFEICILEWSGVHRTTACSRSGSRSRHLFNGPIGTMLKVFIIAGLSLDTIKDLPRLSIVSTQPAIIL